MTKTEEARAKRRADYYKHHAVLEEIYQALRPSGPLAKCWINCPCGTEVSYRKIKQHILCKKHCAVCGDTPSVSQFL